MQYGNNGGINVCITILKDGVQTAFTVPLGNEQFTNVAKVTVLDKDGKTLDASKLCVNRINQKVKSMLSRSDHAPLEKKST